MPHHGLDLVDPDEPFSVADFAGHAAAGARRRSPRGAARRSSPAARASGSARSPAASRSTRCPGTPPVRAALEAELVAGGRGCRLVARLRALAPALAARVDLRNPRRVVRALEIATILGRRAAPRAAGLRRARSLRLGLDVADRALHGRGSPPGPRAQFDGGILEEAAALRARYDPALPAFSAIGYARRWTCSTAASIARATCAVNVRRNIAFARRQRTWFRRDARHRGGWTHRPARPAAASILAARSARSSTAC